MSSAVISICEIHLVPSVVWKMINVCENGGVFGVFFVNSQFIELLLVILYKK